MIEQWGLKARRGWFEGLLERAHGGQTRIFGPGQNSESQSPVKVCLKKSTGLPPQPNPSNSEPCRLVFAKRIEQCGFQAMRSRFKGLWREAGGADQNSQSRPEFWSPVKICLKQSSGLPPNQICRTVSLQGLFGPNGSNRGASRP